MFSSYLIVPTALGPGVDLASNRNEYRRKRVKLFLGSRALPVREAGSQHPHLRDSCLAGVGSVTSHSPIGLHGVLPG
jgi:hypothetical protein